MSLLIFIVRLFLIQTATTMYASVFPNLSVTVQQIIINLKVGVAGGYAHRLMQKYLHACNVTNYILTFIWYY